MTAKIEILLSLQYNDHDKLYFTPLPNKTNVRFVDESIIDKLDSVVSIILLYVTSVTY